MANITELVKNIRNAILGKEVRESIAEAIEQCYEDASKNGNANMEVTEARGDFSTLNNRLDNSDIVKADKSEVNRIKNNFKSQTDNLQSQVNGLVSGSPLVATSVAEMTDTSRVYVNTKDGHWYTYNGASWIAGGVYQSTGIDYEPYQFFENNLGIFSNNDNSGLNIFNPFNSILGMYLEASGKFSSNDTHNTTDYLPVKPLTNYCNNLNTELFWGFYDINKKWISREVSKEYVETPENCYYIRVSYFANLLNLKIFEGVTMPDANYTFTEFIRNCPIIKNTAHAKLMRGSITIKTINYDNKTIILNVADNTILFCENCFFIVNSGDYTINNNQAIFVNAITGKLEVQPINLPTTSFIQLYNDLYFLGFHSDCIVYHDILKKYEVNAKGFLTYEKVSDACQIAKDNETIYIAKGEYEEALELWNKNINLIGENPENTVIYNNSGNYSTPPLEMGAGRLENLTIYAKYEINPTEEWSAYAMHVETNNISNKELICKNVTFKSDLNSCVGIGLRQGTNIEFINCKFINSNKYENGNGTAFYVHDGDSQEYYGVANLKMINCYMYVEKYNFIAKLNSIHEQNKTYVTMIKNTMWCKNNETQNIFNAWNSSTNESNESGFLNLKNWFLTFASHGNNVNTLNSEEREN